MVVCGEEVRRGWGGGKGVGGGGGGQRGGEGGWVVGGRGAGVWTSWDGDLGREGQGDNCWEGVLASVKVCRQGEGVQDAGGGKGVSGWLGVG